MNFRSVLLTGALLLGGMHAQAATIPLTLNFNGPSPNVPAPFLLDADSPGIVNGNCNVAPCLGINSVDSAVLSIAPSLKFSVSSFWFQLLGKKNDLKITTDFGSIILVEGTGLGQYEHNNGYTLDVSTNALFQNITYMSFLMDCEDEKKGKKVKEDKPEKGCTGNSRVDDIKVTYDDGKPTDPGPSPVPVPAAGLMLAGALGGLTALRRRKAA
jgi:hypothetical protein